MRFLAERLGIKVGDSPDVAPIVLVATQGERDEIALEAALRARAAHVLMIASPRKAERLRAVMLARAVQAQRFAALCSPVGPDIGASTPGEIALVAVAEVVRLRRADRSVETTAAGPSAGYVNRFAVPRSARRW